MAPKNSCTARKILATKTSTLKVPLTEPELNEVAEQTYKVEGDLRTFYGHKKEVTSDLKAKEEQLDAQLARLGRLGRDKHDYRPVPVRVEADFKEGKVFEIREDTGEIIAERPVNEQDRQAQLFDGKPRASSELPPTAEEKKAAERAEIEQKADELLKNAGAGDLTKKELKGPAEKFKRAGGR
jgi:hypothetical protein